MRLLRFVMFLVYRYYSTSRWESTPYFSTLMAIALLIYLHLIEVLAILHRLGWYRLDVDYTLEQCRNVALVLLVPVFVVPASLVKKDQLQEMKEDPYNYHKARRGGWMLVLYLIISIILVIKLVIG